MTKLKILTDTSCDLPKTYFAEHDIAVLPIPIRFGNQQYLEGVDLDGAAFYKKVAELGVLPSTSQPSIGEFVAAYREWAERGYDTLLSVHVSEALSGTINAARTAAKQVTDQIRVIPYDSLSGSAAMGFMCVEAAGMWRSGKSVEEIIAHLDAVRVHVRVGLTLATLRYAQMSGRIHGIQALIASLLNVKPIVILQDGKLIAGERVRSRRGALERLKQYAREWAGDRRVNLVVLHAEAQAEAEGLLAELKPSIYTAEAFAISAAPSVAVHFGPGAIGVVVYPLIAG